MPDSTLQIEAPARVDVGNLVVEVTAGPNAALRAETEDETLTVGSAPGNFIVLNDPTVSGYHLTMSRGPEGIRVIDLGSTNGTFLGEVRVRDCTLAQHAVLRLGNTAVRVGNGSGAVVEILASSQLGDLLGSTPIMRRLMARVARVAASSAPVLILGESGTGKELVARAIHQHSARAQGPFVTVDCGALLPNLIASELFGHEKGAFTGADRQHAGAFERAHGGTLFLDEIGELTHELQPQLLGALERRRFVRVGGKKEISVDVRVLCATNRDLREEVNRGAFRMDLYYRVAVVLLALPALHERADDIPQLVKHFLREAGHGGAVGDVIPEAALEELKHYRWPGNVRELRNWVEATLAIGEAPQLLSAGAASEPSEAAFGAILDLPYKEARERVLDGFEGSYLARRLAAAHGNVSQAARHTGMDRSYLIKLLQKHGLK